jgi:phosphate transport system substrate-binding protein
MLKEINILKGEEKEMLKFLRTISFIVVAISFVLTACSTTPAAPVVETQVVNQVVTATPDTSMPTPLPAGSVQITAAGATFPLPLYQAWTYAFTYVDPSTVINYQGIGSGGGKSAIIANTVDFAGSDSALSDQNYTDGKDLQMYPMVASAVVVIYNIKFNAPAAASGTGATPTPTPLPKLILDRQTLVDIYNAKVTKWNDPEIVALNPGLKDALPAASITAVHRSDGSGTTNIFTAALASFSPDWKAGAAQSVEWPVDKAGNGIGGKGNQGVAAAVINTTNSLGYVEIAYAVSNGLTFADMINKSGKQVTANATSLASAITDFGDAFNDKLVATIVDGPGAGSWPIAGYTYLILHTTSMKDCVKASKILEYINWALTDPSAAAQAAKLGYAVLPDAVRAKVLAKLGEVTCNGQPVMKP